MPALSSSSYTTGKAAGFPAWEDSGRSQTGQGSAAQAGQAAGQATAGHLGLFSSGFLCLLGYKRMKSGLLLMFHSQTAESWVSQ